MSADPKPAQPALQAALARWEYEGGADAQRLCDDGAAQLAIARSMKTELEHLHIRVIALENLLIALLAQDPDRARRLGRGMASFISPRPGFTQHSRTLGAAVQMGHAVERAQHFQGWVEGEL
jgi:hypothetical protein